MCPYVGARRWRVKSNPCVLRRFVASPQRDAARLTPTPITMQSNVATAPTMHMAMSVLGASGLLGWDDVDVVKKVDFPGAVVAVVGVPARVVRVVRDNLVVHSASHCLTRTELLPLRANAAYPDAQMICCKSPGSWGVTPSTCTCTPSNRSISTMPNHDEPQVRGNRPPRAADPFRRFYPVFVGLFPH